MATARELLEQADALMQRNRIRVGPSTDIPVLTDAIEPIRAPAMPVAPAANVDVPVLTDVVEAVDRVGTVSPWMEQVNQPAAKDATAAAEAAAAPEAELKAGGQRGHSATDKAKPLAAATPALSPFSPVPEQINFELPDDPPIPGDPSDWLVMDTIDPSMHSVTGLAPDTLAVVPPVTLRAAGSEATPPPAGSVLPATEDRMAADEAPEETSIEAPARVAKQEATQEAATQDAATQAIVEARKHQTVVQAAAAVLPLDFDELDTPDDTVLGHDPAAVTEQGPPPFPSATVEEERWRALAEQVSMQVLQRIDLFTDTGLKGQLAERLRPSVERASAELVNAITEHVGRLLRTYVSEAIEKEIAQWRRDH